MRAPISVIIPTLNAAEGLPACLHALGEGLQEGLIRELVVSDGGSTDATRTVAEAAGAVILTGAPSRGGQIRRATEVAQGRWILVLHADTVLQPGWSRSVLAALETRDAGCFSLVFDMPGVLPRMVAGWANLRSRLFGLPYGDQGLLIPAEVLQEVGGYPDIPLMEDVALARALRGRLHLFEARAVTSAEKYRQQGWFRRGGRNLLTLFRYLMGADPEVLARDYRR